MNDGGMGSIYFEQHAKAPEVRRFGRRIAEVTYQDLDGAVVLASLNVDRDGELYELDVWRTDFAPVKKLDNF